MDRRTYHRNASRKSISFQVAVSEPAGIVVPHPVEEPYDFQLAIFIVTDAVRQKVDRGIGKDDINIGVHVEFL